MRRTMTILTSIGLLALAACDRTAPANAPAAAATPPATATTSATDPELEQLKAVKPVDACALLNADKLKAVYPDLAFDVQQAVAPRMSGYTWDSRCAYRAGVGTQQIAPDAATHSVDITVATVASEAKAQSDLASRSGLEQSSPSYQAQPDLGAGAYTVTDTAMARVFFVKGQSEIQISVSDLNSSNADKIAKALALAKSL